MIVLLLACADCPEGTAEAPGGDCLPITQHAETQEEALELLPACEPRDIGDRLDVAAGCADGLCAGDSFTQMNAANGTEGSCDPSFFDDDYLYCNWGGEVFAFFDDDDNDGVPDADDTAIGIYIHDEYQGTDGNGHGIGVSLRCWLDEYGEPADIDYEVDDRGYYSVQSLDYDDPNMIVQTSLFDGDGYTDHISLFGF